MEIYKRLLTYLKPYWIRLIWAAVFMGFTSIMIAGQTYVMKLVVDDVFIAKNKQLLYWIPPALIVLSILKGVTWYAKDYLMGYVGQKIVNNIRDQLYDHFQSLSFSYFTKTPTGIIMSRIMNDVNLVQGALTKAPASLLQGLMTMIILSGLILYLNWRLALVSVIALPLAGYALAKFSKRLRMISTQMQEQVGTLSMRLHESIGGIRIV